jgi:hypothetical protein
MHQYIETATAMRALQHAPQLALYRGERTSPPPRYLEKAVIDRPNLDFKLDTGMRARKPGKSGHAFY